MTLLQALQELFVLRDVGTSCGGFLGLVQRGKNGDPDGLAVAVRQDDGGTDILVGLAWVNVQTDVSLNGGGELGRIGFDGQVQSVSEAVSFSLVNQFSGGLVFLAAAFNLRTGDGSSAFGLLAGLF